MEIQHVVALIVEQLEHDREVTQASLKAAHEAATHEESKAENKYDTRGLEAAYLADGQRRRLTEIEAALVAYRNLQAGSQSTVVRVGSLVLLESEGAERWVFLGPDGAGLKVEVRGAEILVISPRSPLGAAILGAALDDEIDVNVGGRRHRYSIVHIA
jgi:transcription elongation GreA/GreB family factor